MPVANTPALRRRKRLITSVYFILSGLITATWASRIPDVQATLGLGNAAWGTVLFAVPVGLMTGLAIASWLTNRFGILATMTVSCIVCAVLLVTLGNTGNRWLLTFLLFLTGFSRTILNIAMNTHSIETQKLYEKPVIVSFHGMWSLACFAAAGIGTLMLWMHVSPRLHFLFMAIFCVVIVLFFRKDAGGESIRTGERKPFFIMPDRYLLTLGMIAFCGMLCENTMFDWSVNYFQKTVGAKGGAVTSGYTAFIIFMTLGRFIGDRLLRSLGAVKLLVLHGLLIAIGYGFAVLFPTPLAAAAGFALVGFGASVVVPVVYTLAAKSMRMQSSYALSSVSMIGSLGFITGPLLVGGLSDWIGMQGAFGFVGLMGIAMSLLALRVSLPKDKNESGDDLRPTA